MRLKPEKVELLAELIVASLKNTDGVTLKAEDGELVFAISQVIQQDLEDEEEIEQEAYKVLEEHRAELQRSGASTHSVLQKIKQRIARERKFTL